MKSYLALFKQTFQEFGHDKAQRLGAALAYYTVFSIGPLLLIAISVAGLVWGEEAAQGQISTQLKNVLGPNVADSVEKMVAGAAREKSGVLATIIGIATLMFGASGVFGQLKDALDTIWNVEPKKSSGVVSFIKDRFLSMAMVFGVGFLLLVSLLLDAVIAAMGDYLGRIVGGESILHIIQLVLSYVLVTVLLAAIFKFLPDITITWRDVWLGALFTSVLFVLGKYALGLYLGRAAVGSSYGAAGSLVVLLVWVYYSAQIVFFGAEFTQVYTRQRGSLKGDTSKAEAKAAAGRVEDRPKSGAQPAQPPKQSPAAAYPRRATPAAGGAAKVAAGGAAGLVVGTLLGGITATLIAVKSLKRLLTAPFK